MRESASTIRVGTVLRGLGLSTLQLILATLGSLGGICSRFQVALFEKVSPARMTVCGTLFRFKIF